LKSSRNFEIIYTLKKLTEETLVGHKKITVYWEFGAMPKKSEFESDDEVHVEWKFEANGKGICVKEFVPNSKFSTQPIGEHIFLNPIKLSIENFS
jgi:hypothetical protein